MKTLSYYGTYQIVVSSFFLLSLHTRVVFFVYLHPFEVSVLVTGPSTLEMKFCRQFSPVSVFFLVTVSKPTFTILCCRCVHKLWDRLDTRYNAKVFIASDECVYRWCQMCFVLEMNTLALDTNTFVVGDERFENTCSSFSYSYNTAIATFIQTLSCTHS